MWRHGEVDVTDSSRHVRAAAAARVEWRGGITGGEQVIKRDRPSVCVRLADRAYPLVAGNDGFLLGDACIGVTVHGGGGDGAGDLGVGDVLRPVFDVQYLRQPARQRVHGCPGADSFGDGLRQVVHAGIGHGPDLADAVPLQQVPQALLIGDEGGGLVVAWFPVAPVGWPGVQHGRRGGVAEGVTLGPRLRQDLAQRRADGLADEVHQAGHGDGERSRPPLGDQVPGFRYSGAKCPLNPGRVEGDEGEVTVPAGPAAGAVTFWVPRRRLGGQEPFRVRVQCRRAGPQLGGLPLQLGDLRRRGWLLRTRGRLPRGHRVRRRRGGLARRR